LEGLYIWESSWEDNPDPQDGKRKLGVQITPIKEVIDAYKNGDLKSINFLVGVIMKNSRGKANPSTAKQILENILNK